MTTHENNGIQGAISKKGEANYWLRLFYFSDRKERQHSAL
jgi:spore germination protein YaaH